MLKPRVGSVRRKVRLALDEIADRRLNVDTLSGSWTAVPLPNDPRYAAWKQTAARDYFPEAASEHDDSHPNLPVAWLALRSFIDDSLLRSDDVFYDIGCGNGRVLCYVARRRLRKCVGVELSPQFGAKAVENGRRLRGRLSPIEVIVGDAAQVDYINGTIFFLSNPFGAETMRSVVDRIGQTLATNPRRVLMIYVNGSFPEVLHAANWLRFVGQRKFLYSKVRAEYWIHEPNVDGNRSVAS